MFFNTLFHFCPAAGRIRKGVHVSHLCSIKRAVCCQVNNMRPFSVIDWLPGNNINAFPYSLCNSRVNSTWGHVLHLLWSGTEVLPQLHPCLVTLWIFIDRRRLGISLCSFMIIICIGFQMSFCWLTQTHTYTYNKGNTVESIKCFKSWWYQTIFVFWKFIHYKSG